MVRAVRNLPRDDMGGTLVEAALVFPLLLVLTFGLMEFGNALWQYNSAEKATAAGARYLATRGPVATGVADCFVNTSATAGTSCAQVPGASAWSMTCGGGSGSCNATVMNQMIARMQAVAPFITPANVRVDLRGSDMGFVGRGAPVPLITVRTSGLSYNFIALNSLLGFAPVTMPGFDATSVGEDQNEGPGS